MPNQFQQTPYRPPTQQYQPTPAPPPSKDSPFQEQILSALQALQANHQSTANTLQANTNALQALQANQQSTTQLLHSHTQSISKLGPKWDN